MTLLENESGFSERGIMFEAIVIGTSAGGFKALSKIIPVLSKEYSLPTIIVQHCKIDADNFLSEHLNTLSKCSDKKLSASILQC